MKLSEVRDIKIKPSLIIFISSACLALLLSACGDEVSPEDQVRQFLAEAVSAAESRDVLALRALVSPSYSDASGRDGRAVVALATAYFLRKKNIHLFKKISDIRFPAEKQAKAALYVAMSGSSVTGNETLLDFKASLYQFDLELMREGDGWLLQKATWRRVSADELLN
ncbi:MAG: hypothetical protein QNL62_06895 [Gammaproteobacteria bacterium]|nr:hypothetical protein [Gammaproteobacteria bacterium]